MGNYQRTFKIITSGLQHAKLSRQRDLLYLSHFDGNIKDEEFMILLELIKQKNRDLPYWTYPCLEEFRFMRNDIYKLRETFNIPYQIVCYNGTSVTDIEGLRIYLKRFSYKC